MSKFGFKELRVWQVSKDLSVAIYKMTQSGKIAKDFSLRDQIRRSAISIPSNIAEGDERYTDKEAVRFFYIAKGSLAELVTQLEISFEIGYFKEGELKNTFETCQQLGKMIGALIKARSKS